MRLRRQRAGRLVNDNYVHGTAIEQHNQVTVFDSPVFASKAHLISIHAKKRRTDILSSCQTTQFRPHEPQAASDPK